MYLGTTGHLI